jgi:dTMP kinase
LNGKYIIFEGIDGVGKSTQIELVKEFLPEATFTREPGGTEFGIKIRNILLNSEMTLSPVSETLFFLVDRAEHYSRVVKWRIENGHVVVSDRGLLSGIAYSRGSAFTDQELIELNLKTLEDKKPDLIVLFKISREQYIERLKERSGLDRIESFGVDFAMETQDRFLKYGKEVADHLIVIDAEKSADEVQKKIRNEVGRCLDI